MTYTWTPIAIFGYPQYEGQTDVVTSVLYTVLADDGDGHTATLSNVQQTPLDPAAPFIPYADLTPEIVIGWVQFNMGPEGVANIEANLSAQIAAQINPPVVPVSLPLPWVAPPAPDLSAPVN
jgi:hypothetical protein